MTGRVQRELLMRNRKDPDRQEFEFLMNKKTGYARVFESRRVAIGFFHSVCHYSRDDMRFVYWLDKSNDIRCEIMTGRYLEMDLKTDGSGSGMTCDNFWSCDSCGKIYRKSEHVTCPEHPEQHMDDNADALVSELLRDKNILSEDERSQLEDLLYEEEDEE